jgi:hypothetical protein
MKTPKPKAAPRIRVSDLNIRKTAQRVLAGQSLVSPEIEYVQRTLGASATQQDMDAQVIAVRRLPWASIVVPD